MSQVVEARAAGVGIYGKIPTERDFVRINTGAFLRAGLDGWFQEGVELMKGEHTMLPAEPALFFLVPSASHSPFIGVFSPGQDAVGRVFPVVIFSVLDPPPGRDEFPLLPVRLSSFGEACARVAVASQGNAAVGLASEISVLASTIRPTDAPLDVQALLAHSSSAELCAAVGGTPDAAAYALTTLMAACSRTNAQPPDSPGRVLVLDCPAPTEDLRTFWLEIVRHHLNAGMQMPSAFWTREGGRLLIALGPPPSAMLSYLANPDHKGTRRWPLRTQSQPARAAAAQKLSPEQNRVLSTPDTSLAETLSAFSCP